MLCRAVTGLPSSFLCCGEHKHREPPQTITTLVWELHLSIALKQEIFFDTQASTLLLQDIVDHLESTRKLMTPAALREVVLHDVQASPELREALARNPKIALDAQGAYRYKVGGLSNPEGFPLASTPVGLLLPLGSIEYS